MRERYMYKILLIGFGNLGRHYLTALDRLQMHIHVHIVEIDTEILTDVPTTKICYDNFARKITVSTEIETTPFDPDITIVVTPASSRLSILKKLVEKGIQKQILLEKPLSNCVEDLNSIKNLNLQFNKIWVNTQRRTFCVYKDLQQKILKIDGREKISMNIHGGNLNLLSNTIHFIDLAEFLFCSNIQCINFTNPTEVYTIKRKGTIDLYGAISFTLESGNKIEVINTKGDAKRVISLVQNGQKLYNIFESERYFTRGDENKHMFEFPGVSSFATAIVASILKDQACDLPVLLNSLRQHECFLTSLEAIAADHGITVPVNFS
jgi:hypothetical protein